MMAAPGDLVCIKLGNFEIRWSKASRSNAATLTLAGLVTMTLIRNKGEDDSRLTVVLRSRRMNLERERERCALCAPEPIRLAGRLVAVGRRSTVFDVDGS
jgi:hypothetical protein